MSEETQSSGRQSPAKKNSFTLTELLVVITILGGLAALVIPAVKGGLNSAKAAKTISNLKQTGVMLMNYAAENNNCFPNSWDLEGMRKGGNAKFFQGDLSIHAGLKVDWSKNPPFAEIFYDPCLPQAAQHPWGSYGVNESILFPGSLGVRISRITSPSKKVIYCSASGGATTFKSSWIFTGNDFVNQGLSPGIYHPDPRNIRKAACLFADGHVESLDVRNMDQAARRRHFTLDP